MELNLEQYLHRIDMVMKPYALIVNPLDEDEMTNALSSDLKERFKIVHHPAVERGKAYIVDRKHLESYTESPSFVNPYYRSEAENEENTNII